MNERATTVLLIEDKPEDAKPFLTSLRKASDGSFHAVWVKSVTAAIACLEKARFDAILLDLAIPDGPGIKTFFRIAEAAPDALIMILGSPEKDDSNRQSVDRGAYDAFVRGRADAQWTPQALRSVIEHKAIQDALLQNDARFHAMSDASPLGIFVADPDGTCVYTNEAYRRISGLRFEQMRGTCWSAAIHPDDLQRVLAEWHAAVVGGTPFQTETRFLQPDGVIVWVRLNAMPMRGDPQVHGHVQTVEDISERKVTEQTLRVAEAALFEEKERAQTTLNSIGDAVLTSDLMGNVTYLNPVAEAMTGWTCDEAQGRPLTEVFRIFDSETRVAVNSPAQRAIDESRTIGLVGDCVLIRRDGSESGIEDSSAPIYDRDGIVVGAVIVFHDVTRSREVSKRMSYLAQHDFLTGLPNRALLTERLSRAIGLAHRRRKQVALLFLDMDHFKNINDSLGHRVGDEVLKSVAGRLTARVRTTDTVSRQGGDEFVLLLSEIEHPLDAAHIADKLLEVFSLPHHVSGHSLHVTLSIGISLYPDDGVDPEMLMQHADAAMYRAKANGRNNALFFKPGICGEAGR
ncbi:MAG TPA: diguanylate cyclase [Rhodocyclaceae bacterium]|nr:diguanylate cyclase [Rhodocyclaceae bacterium]